MKIKISKPVARLIWLMAASAAFIYASMSLLVYYFTKQA